MAEVHSLPQPPCLAVCPAQGELCKNDCAGAVIKWSSWHEPMCAKRKIAAKQVDTPQDPWLKKNNNKKMVQLSGTPGEIASTSVTFAAPLVKVIITCSALVRGRHRPTADTKFLVWCWVKSRARLPRTSFQRKYINLTGYEQAEWSVPL